MGACQSALACQCIDEDAAFLQSGHHHPHKPGFTSSSNNSRNSNDRKLKIELISPTGTEATTPGSALYTPASWNTTTHNGPLSLTSALASTTLQYHQQQKTIAVLTQQPCSKFTFSELEDLDSVVDDNDHDYDDDEAPSDEDDVHSAVVDLVKTTHKIPVSSVFPCMERPAEIPKDPKSIILNPPLVAPPRGEAEMLLLQAASLQTESQSRVSVPDTIVRDFRKLQDRATMVQRQDQKSKRQAKLEDRIKDVEGYRHLFAEYKEMDELHKATELQKATEAYLAPVNNKSLNTATRDDVGKNGRRQCIQKSNSFDLKDTDSWFVNFKKEMKYDRGYHDDDNKSCQSGLSLLSKASMGAQKALFAEKRRCREATYASRKKALDASIQEEENQSNSNPSSSKGSKNYEAYFKAFMEEGINARSEEEPNTPQMSLPRIEVHTNESKVVIDGRYDYGPVSKVQAAVPAPAPAVSQSYQKPSKSITDMEVFIQTDKRRDDTSGITDADFERDFVLHRRRGGKVSQIKNEDASLISYGSLPDSIKDQDISDQNNKPSGVRGDHRSLQKSQSMSIQARSIFSTSGVPCKHDTLGDRITNLERKMGIVHSNDENDVARKSSCTEEQKSSVFRMKGVTQQNRCANGRTFVSETMEACETGSPIPDLQSPRARPPAIFPSSDELEPTKLEAMFNRTSSTSSSFPVAHMTNKNASDVRESIVIGNASKCQLQVRHSPGFNNSSNVAFLTKEEFQRMSNGHAMVNVSKHPLEQDAYIVRESENEGSSENCALNRGSHPQVLKGCRQDDANSSTFANDITEQITNVLHRYRNDGILDAHALLQSGSTVDMEEGDSFCQVYGKLYTA